MHFSKITQSTDKRRKKYLSTVGSITIAAIISKYKKEDLEPIPVILWIMIVTKNEINARENVRVIVLQNNMLYFFITFIEVGINGTYMIDYL